MNDTATALPSFTEQAAEIVAAYVAHNHVALSEMPNLIRSVHDALAGLDKPVAAEAPTEPLKPAVSVKKSITDDYIISLEDGRKFKSLRRYLMTSFGMTPADYRAKWGLPTDYPMVAPNYAKARSALAKESGLGQQRRKRTGQAVEATSEPEAAAPAPKKGRARKAA